MKLLFGVDWQLCGQQSCDECCSLYVHNSDVIYCLHKVTNRTFDFLINCKNNQYIRHRCTNVVMLNYLILVIMLLLSIGMYIY